MTDRNHAALWRWLRSRLEQHRVIEVSLYDSGNLGFSWGNGTGTELIEDSPSSEIGTTDQRASARVADSGAGVPTDEPLCAAQSKDASAPESEAHQCSDGTPSRVDAQMRIVDGFSVVPADFARTLVRELAEANIRADDAQLSCISAEEERELCRKKNLANCLQIAALQEALMKAEAAESSLSALEKLVHRAMNCANGLTNYVERRPGLHAIEQEMAAIQAAIDAARTGVPNDR